MRLKWNSVSDGVRLTTECALLSIGTVDIIFGMHMGFKFFLTHSGLHHTLWQGAPNCGPQIKSGTSPILPQCEKHFVFC